MWFGRKGFGISERAYRKGCASRYCRNSSKPWSCNFSGTIGEKATLLEVIMIGVVGVFGARTTAAGGTYTNSGGTIISDGIIFTGEKLGFIRILGKCLEKTKWEKVETEVGVGLNREKRAEF